MVCGPATAVAAVVAAMLGAVAEAGYEQSTSSFATRRFTARYDACNDQGRFVLVTTDDDGDCQVLCGPSGSSKLVRLKNQSVCRTANKNEPGICVAGVCAPSPVLTEREERPATRRPTRPPRTTVKFIPSTFPPITSGFTYAYLKQRTTGKPSTMSAIAPAPTLRQTAFTRSTGPPSRLGSQGPTGTTSSDVPHGKTAQRRKIDP